MKRTSIAVITALLGLQLAACSHPYAQSSDYVDVSPNETAFLIAMDGDTKNNQAKLNSIEFLEANRVSTKRIEIPRKEVNACPSCMWGDWRVLPTAILITVDRTPVTREWTSLPGTGTSTSNQSFSVETNESIDFSIGATITAHVDEREAAKFLYYYGNIHQSDKGAYVAEQLASVIDGNIRSYIGARLSDEFGKNSLDYDRMHKHDIFDSVGTSTRDFFAARGIIIDNFGYSEGMTYHDPQIQDAINKKFVADNQKQVAQDMLEAAELQAKAGDAVRQQQELVMRQRELDLENKAIDKWNGVMPATLVNGTMPFGVPIAAK